MMNKIDRQCASGDGIPKIIFPSLEHAKTRIGQMPMIGGMNQKTASAYKCGKCGMFHIGNNYGKIKKNKKKGLHLDASPTRQGTVNIYRALFNDGKYRYFFTPEDRLNKKNLIAIIQLNVGISGMDAADVFASALAREKGFKILRLI